MTTRPLVYVSGPLTKPDPLVNTRKACLVADQLLASGLVVPVVPHLGSMWHLVSPKSYEEWMSYDIGLLAHCHALIRIPGESPGADREEDYAAAVGMPIFGTVAEVVKWAQHAKMV